MAFGEGVAEVQVVTVRPARDLAKQTAVAAGGIGGETVLMLVLHRKEIAPVARMGAITCLLGCLAEAAEFHADVAAWRRQAVLGVQQHRTAQGVETEHWVGDGHEMDGAYGVGRNQVPVHHVAEGLVHPHPVLKHRQALRCAQQRRGGEAVEVQRGLQRVALLVGQRHAGQMLRQQLREIGGGLLLEGVVVNCIGMLRRGAKALGAASKDGHGLQLHHGRSGRRYRS